MTLWTLCVLADDGSQSAARVNRAMNSLDVKTFRVIGVDVSE
jgi:hypothetical protein